MNKARKLATNVMGYTIGEEIANSVTHGIGAALSVAGLTLLVALAVIYGDVWRVVSFSIYGSSLVVLYLCSTLYHSIQHPKAKQVLRIFDHSAIYLLIAGTYTPFTLVSMRGPWGWTLFGVVWGWLCWASPSKRCSLAGGRSWQRPLTSSWVGW